MCTACKLSQVKSQFTIGFNDWKNVYAQTLPHETSPQVQSTISVKVSLHSICNIQYKHPNRPAVTVLSASFRKIYQGETIRSVHNGNFLGILELLSEYDGFFSSTH